MERICYSSAQGASLNLPCLGDWSRFLLETPITVKYVESAEESLRLVIPKGQAGTISLRYLQSDLLGVSCEPVAGTIVYPELTLEIHHRGLDEINMPAGGRMTVSGSVELLNIAVRKDGVLDLQEAKVRTDPDGLLAYVEDHARCLFYSLDANRVDFHQKGHSFLQVDLMHCTENLLMSMEGDSEAVIRGYAACITTQQADCSRLDATHLFATKGYCAAWFAANLQCHVADLHSYTSCMSKLENNHPNPQKRMLEGVAEYRLLRMLPLSDAMLLLRHLKPLNEDPSAEFRLYGSREPLYLFSHDHATYRKEIRDGRAVFLDKYGYEISIAAIQRQMERWKSKGDQVLVQVFEAEVNWCDIPDVRERWMQTEAKRFECLNPEAVNAFFE